MKFNQIIIGIIYVIYVQHLLKIYELSKCRRIWDT